MIFLGFAIIACVFQFVHCSTACNGYGVKVADITNYECNNLKIENARVELNDDCKLLINACITIDKPFEKAKIKYELKKGVIALKSEKDFCEYMKKFNFSIECPISEPGHYCADITNPPDLSKYKKLFSMAEGNITISGAKILYDGDKEGDALDIVLNLFKK